MNYKFKDFDNRYLMEKTWLMNFPMMNKAKLITVIEDSWVEEIEKILLKKISNDQKIEQIKLERKLRDEAIKWVRKNYIERDFTGNLFEAII